METNILHTKSEVIEQIRIIEQAMYRYKQNPRAYDTVNLCEHYIEDLQDVLNNTNWNLQLADCDHLFWC